MDDICRGVGVQASRSRRNGTGTETNIADVGVAQLRKMWGRKVNKTEEGKLKEDKSCCGGVRGGGVDGASKKRRAQRGETDSRDKASKKGDTLDTGMHHWGAVGADVVVLIPYGDDGGRYV